MNEEETFSKINTNKNKLKIRKKNAYHSDANNGREIHKHQGLFV